MTGRDYQSLQQLLPPQRRNDWNDFSWYSRQLMSSFSHSVYDRYLAPLQRDRLLHFSELDVEHFTKTRSFRFHDIDTAQSILNHKRGIDRVFNTN